MGTKRSWCKGYGCQGIAGHVCIPQFRVNLAPNSYRIAAPPCPSTALFVRRVRISERGPEEAAYARGRRAADG